MPRVNPFASFHHRRRPCLPWAAVLTCVLCLWPALAPAATALVTVVEGESRLVHGAGSVDVAEAMALPAAAIVHTTAGSRLLRVEWPDGSALDLGPDTMALIVDKGLSERAPKSPGVYLLKGWAKLTGAAASSAPVLMSGFGELPPFKGVAVVAMQEGAGQRGVFSEAGPLLWQERGGKALTPLATGQFYARPGAEPGTVLLRPPAAMLQQMPRAFRDTLPHRFAAVQRREVKLPPSAMPAYAEVRPWLVAGDPSLRRQIVNRFAPWSRDAALKRELIRHINEHHEWAALVLPKPDAASAPRRAP